MTLIKRHLFILILSVLPALKTAYCQDLSLLDSVRVIDPSNKTTALNLPTNKHVVLFVLGTDCPITQKYVPTIKKLKQQFGGVTFAGIFPKQFTSGELARFIKEYELTIPCFIDPDMQIIKLLGASVTPEVFLINSNRRIVYAGAIDNWFFSLGKYRTNITKHYLRDAIAALSDGREIKLPRTEAIGCPLPREKDDKEIRHHH